MPVTSTALRRSRLGATGLVAAALAVLAGCEGAASTEGAASCAGAVVFDGVAMPAMQLPELNPPPTAKLVSATVPGCGDGDEQETMVRSFSGVDPHLGLADPEIEDRYFLPLGRLVSLRSHPLNLAYFGRAPIWPSSRECPKRRLVGEVNFEPQVQPQFTVLTDGTERPAVVRVKRGTRVLGERSYGQPLLTRGDRIIVKGRACKPTQILASVIDLSR